MRADRLLTILFLLQAKERLTARQLATDLEVSERTIYRDIDSLCAAGVPIISELGPGGGFALPANYRISTNHLTLNEARALLLAAVAGPLKELGLDKALDAACLKLTAALPASSRHIIEQDQQRLHIDITDWAQSAEAVPYLSVIQDALWNDCALYLRYTTDVGQRIECYLRPYGLVVKAGTWYLIGGVGDAVTILCVAAIQEAVKTNEPFVRPEAFNLAAYWQQWCHAHEAKRPSTIATIYVATVHIPVPIATLGAERYQLLQKIHRLGAH